MNYRHGFHAGNFGDALKHAVLALALQRLREKDSPFCVIDSHAGAGAYRLGDEAGRTGEYRHGIGRLYGLKQAPAPLQPYLAAVRALNGRSGLVIYPGSPELARAALRANDRLVLVERAEEPARQLKQQYGADARIAVHRRDGWEAIRALLPPTPRRGLLLIDPPFEDPAEWGELEQALDEARRRWPTGQVLAWYPLKERAAADQLHEAAARLGVPALAIELQVAALDRRSMNGCGLVYVNPPWRMDAEAAALTEALAAALARGPGAGAATRWLTPPA